MEKLSLPGNWTFAYEGAKAPVRVEQKESRFIFEVPYGLSGKLVIELKSYDAGKQKVSGTYTLQDESDEIAFSVKELGKKMIGQPVGFNGNRNWVLSR